MAKELEAIENAKLEALGLGLIRKTCELYLDTAKELELKGCDIIENCINEALNSVKQALLKAEKNAELLGFLKNNLYLIPTETGEDEIAIFGCPTNGDTISPNDEGYEVIKNWLNDKEEL